MNKNTIYTNRIAILFLYLIWISLSFIFLYQINSYEYNKWITHISYFIVFNLVVHLSIFRVQSIKILSMTGLFVLFIYLFHFGQVIMIGLFPNYEFQNFNYIVHMDEYILKKTVFSCILFLNAIVLGILFTDIFINHDLNTEQDRENNVPEEYYDEQIFYSRKIGEIILLISLPIQLYIDIHKLILAYSGGYSAAISLSTIGIFSAIGSFSYTAVAMLIIGYSKSKTGKIIFYLATFWLVIVMLNGNRGHQMVALIVIFYVAHKANVIWFSKKHILAGIVFLWLGTAFLNMVYDIRQIGIAYFINNFSYIMQQQFISSNPILETVESFGETIYTPYLVLKKGIENIYGRTYLYSLVSLVPDVGGIFTDINKSANFVKTLNTKALGGSFIGELYFNFGFFGFIPAMVLGGLLHKVSRKIENSFLQYNYIGLAYILPIYINSLWWVRDSFSNILRPIIWQAVLTFLVVNFIKSKTSELVQLKG